MQGPAPIPVFRPSYLTDGLEFQGSLTESPANIFYQSVKASRASISAGGAGRFQFQWRSVSDNLLMSPTVMLRFKVRVTTPNAWSQVAGRSCNCYQRSRRSGRTQSVALI